MMLDPAQARVIAEPLVAERAAQQQLLTALLERLHELEPDGARWSATLLPPRRHEEAFGHVLRLQRALPSGAEQVSTITAAGATASAEAIAYYVHLVATWQANVLGWVPQPHDHRLDPWQAPRG